MALVTPALIAALFTGFKREFQGGLDGVETQHTKIASIIKSSSKSNTYGWLGKFPSLAKWVGDRQIKSMQAHGYQIVNEDYESTVGVDKNDIEDDELGIYSPLFQEMGNAAAIHPDELVFAMLGAGFTTLCYDGQNFFDTDHPVNAEVDGSGADVSVANMIVDADYVTANGAPWFILDTSRAIKPIIYQDRKQPQLIAMTKNDDESVFMSREFRYGVDKRCAVGFGFWQMAFAMKKALTADSLWEAIQAMRAIEGDGGKKLGIKPTILVVPTSLEKVATRLLERELDANSSNELKGRIELLVADYL